MSAVDSCFVLSGQAFEMDARGIDFWTAKKCSVAWFQNRWKSVVISHASHIHGVETTPTVLRFGGILLKVKYSTTGDFHASNVNRRLTPRTLIRGFRLLRWKRQLCHLHRCVRQLVHSEPHWQHYERPGLQPTNGQHVEPAEHNDGQHNVSLWDCREWKRLEWHDPESRQHYDSQRYQQSGQLLQQDLHSVWV